jgi:hypothetical protein
MMDGNPAEEAKIPDSYAGESMPSKMEDAEELAERLNVAVEELPEHLMKLKQDLDDKMKKVRRFAEMFQQRPSNRAQRRANKFGHSKLHY